MVIAISTNQQNSKSFQLAGDAEQREQGAEVEAVGVVEAGGHCHHYFLLLLSLPWLSFSLFLPLTTSINLMPSLSKLPLSWSTLVIPLHEIQQSLHSKSVFCRNISNGRSSQKISKKQWWFYFPILLLGGPSPPSQLVPNPFNWSPNTNLMK